MSKLPKLPDSPCGHPVNSNGNCTDPDCWNSNAKRHEGLDK